MSRLYRENGLEWLKMRFCYSGIKILMLLWYNKRGVLRKLRVRAGVCVCICIPYK